jgi:glycosyltransferase involved in cell wall biosynthesis
MRVTIAIPCYKQAEYLPDAIESAIAQTVECEVIVVNDGSPDNTKQIAENYGVKVISQVNKGLASARNTAIMNMTGDIFLPLDADDILMPNCVEKILDAFKAMEADVVAPSMKTFGTSNETAILMTNPTLEDFKLANRIGYFSAIKKEALLECGGYSPRMDKGWEDYHLWIDLLSRGKKIVTIPEPLVLYRTKEQSMWKDSLKHKEELTAQINKDFPHVCLK